MNIATDASWIAASLLIAMIVLMEVGRRIGLGRAPGAEKPPVGAIEGALFALLGLLIAFTFSGAASRFDDRRKLVVEEANDIGTAWLRLDLLPADAQPAMRSLFRQYLDSRLEIYRRLPDIEAAKKELARSNQLQIEIWTAAVSACQSGSAQCTMLLLPALNQMIDITTTRTMTMQIHPPRIIFIMLFVFSLSASVLAGYGMAMGKRSWIHIISFSVALSLTVYVILDLEHPRFGFIRIDAADQVLRELRQSMD